MADALVWVTAGIIRRGKQLLICQRKAGSRFELKWEFPGGKLEPGESPQCCLARELEEELGIDAAIGAELHRTDFRYANGFAVRLLFFSVESCRGAPENLAFERIAWVKESDLLDYDFLDADRDFIQRIETGEVRL